MKQRYRVSVSQPWSEVEVFFTSYPEAMDQLLAAVTETDPRVQFELLTVKSLLETARGDVPTELRERYRGATVEGWCRMVNSLRAGMDTFLKFMEHTTPPETLHGKRMSKGTLKGNLEEAVLWTLKKAFTLQGLEAAQNLTVYEYEIARKEVYNDAVVAYNKSMYIDGLNSRRR